MQIAPSAIIRPSSPRPEGFVLDARMSAAAQQALLSSIADDDPAAAVFKRNGRDIMSLPGIAGVRYLKSVPGQLTVTFADDAFRALADNVLRDTVEGVKLVLESQTPGAPTPWPWWVNSVSQMVNAVKAMPGVVDASGIAEHGQQDMMITVSDAAAAARLKPLISEWLGSWRTFMLPQHRPAGAA